MFRKTVLRSPISDAHTCAAKEPCEERIHRLPPQFRLEALVAAPNRLWRVSEVLLHLTLLVLVSSRYGENSESLSFLRIVSGT